MRMCADTFGVCCESFFPSMAKSGGTCVFVFVVIVVVIAGLGGSFAQHTEDPCDIYVLLNDEWRRPESNEEPYHCDNMTQGWYAFEFGAPAVIPTVCLQDNTCGARVPLHVEFPPTVAPQSYADMAEGDMVSVWLCGSFNVLGAVDCCVQRQPVTIKRCAHDVFVYELRPQGVCPVAACAVPWSGDAEPIHELFVAKPGDIPRSLLPPLTLFPEICPEGQPRCPDDSCAPCPTTDSTPLPYSTTIQEYTRALVPDVQPTTSLISSSAASLVPDNSSSLATSSDSSVSLTPIISDDLLPSANVSDNSSETTDSPADSTQISSTANMSSLAEQQENVTDSVPETTRGYRNATEAVYWSSATDDDGMSTPSESNTTSFSDSSSVKPEGSSAGLATTKRLNVSLETTAVARSSVEVDENDTKTLSTTKTGSVWSTASPESSDLISSVPASSEGVMDPSGHTTPFVGSESTVSTQASSTPEVLSTEAVRFVLNGTFEEAEFRDALLLFVTNVSRQLTGDGKGEEEHGGLHNVSLRSQTSLPDNITLVDVLVADPATNGTIPVQRFITIIQNDNFAELLLAQAGQTLVEVCPSVDGCDGRGGPGPTDGDGGWSPMSLFDRNRGVFIAIIVVASVCLLALLLGLLLLRYRRRGVWVLADHEEKGADLLSVENPLTDRQILAGEQERVSETTLTVNGDHRYATATAATAATAADTDNHSDIPAADEDNGWVVPLEQAPVAAAAPQQGMAEKTEDTQF